MDPEIQALLNYLLSQGQMDPASIDTSFGRAPDQYDKKGNLIPPDLDQQTDTLGFLRNLNTYMADPMVGALSPGGFDYAAFEPTITDEPVDRPGERMLSGYTQRGGWEGLVAEKIAAGGSASEAFALVNQILSDPTNPAYAEIASSLDPIYDATTGTNRMEPDGVTPMLDKSEIRTFARDLEKNFISDPTGNYQDPTTGAWFNRTETPSPAAKAFTDKGWALPSDRYSIDQLMGPEWAAQAQGMDPRSYRENMREQLLPQIEAQRAGIDAQIQDVGRTNARLRQGMPRPGAAPTPGGGGGGGGAVKSVLNFLFNKQPSVEEAMAAQPQPGDPNLLGALFGKQPSLEEAMAGPVDPMVATMGLDPNLVTPKLLEFLKKDQAAATRPLASGAAARAQGGPPGGRPGSPEYAIAGLEKQKKALTGAHGRAVRQGRELFDEDYFYNQGRMRRVNEQGRTPLLDQMMARRMATISSGIPGGYLPGGG